MRPKYNEMSPLLTYVLERFHELEQCATVFLSKRDAAAYLSITEELLESLTEKYGLPAYQNVGTNVCYYKKKDLNEFVELHSVLIGNQFSPEQPTELHTVEAKAESQPIFA